MTPQNLFASDDDARARKKRSISKAQVSSLINRKLEQFAEKKAVGTDFQISLNQGGTDDPTTGITCYKVRKGTNSQQRIGREVSPTGLRVEYALSGGTTRAQQIKICVLELKGNTSVANAVDAAKKGLFKSLANAAPVPSWGIGLNVAEKLTYELNADLFKVHAVRRINIGHNNGEGFYPPSKLGHFWVPLKGKIRYFDNSILGLEPSDAELSRQIIVLVFGGSMFAEGAGSAHGQYDARISVKQYFTDS